MTIKLLDQISKIQQTTNIQDRCLGAQALEGARWCPVGPIQRNRDNRAIQPPQTEHIHARDMPDFED